MDTKKFAQGNYLTPDMVKASPQAPVKVGVIVSDVKIEVGSFGEQLTVMVNFDKEIKTWRLNRESVKNMQKVGSDSLTWLSCKVAFVVVDRKGKEVLIGEPVLD